MARGKKAEKALTPEEKLAQALVPVEEQPYPVPGNWCWTTLSFIADLFNGDRGVNYPSKKDYQSSGIPFINAGAIVDGELDDREFNFISEEKYTALRAGKIQQGDILYCLRGSLGKTAIVKQDGKGAISSSLCILRTNNAVLKKYLYYLLCSDVIARQQTAAENGSAQPNLSAASVIAYLIPLSPIYEQQRIVDRIESLFAKLDEAKEKAQAVVDSFETRKAAILHKAFTGNLIGKGDVTLVPLENIIDEIRIGPFGSALHEEDYIMNGTPVINPKHIANQKIIPQSKVAVSAEKLVELQSYRLKANDIVLGRRGEMGRSAPVTDKEDGWLCGTGSMIIRLKNRYQAKFYSLIISSQASIQYLEGHAVGTTLKNLNEKIVRKLPIPDFTIEEQDKLFHALDSLLSKEQQAKEGAEAVIAQIDTMKKSILARAFRGELGTNDPAEESAVELVKSAL